MRRGFTILEVTLVLTVLLVLAAITVPSLDAMYGESKATAAADMVRARWADARARAVEDGVPYRFAIMPGTGKFRVAPDASEFWSGGGTVAAMPETESPPLVLEEELPKGILFTSDDASGDTDAGGGDWTPLVTFQPDATANADAKITFRVRSSRPLDVQLRALTCAVTVQFQTEGK
ncbi:MAG: prepilin-type N-terminal cleavage/methylation domain-containing protein [Gemmataceae bacterium]